MGIAGHMLGERKLARLRAEYGLDFDKACSRNGGTEARVIVRRLDGDSCIHYEISRETGFEAEEIENPTHWTSCPR